VKVSAIFALKMVALESNGVARKHICNRFRIFKFSFTFEQNGVMF
jgi:hypothetical protein